MIDDRTLNKLTWLKLRASQKRYSIDVTAPVSQPPIGLRFVSSTGVEQKATLFDADANWLKALAPQKQSRIDRTRLVSQPPIF